MKLWEMWKYSAVVSMVLICLLLGLALLAAETHLLQEELPEEALPEMKLPERPVSEQMRAMQDNEFTVRVLDAGIVMGMPLQEYLTGVVRAEMPASFEQEALCAQAVAARTYTLYKMRDGGKHPDADICTNPACCQAYCSAAQTADGGGTAASQNEEKIRKAVTSTDGQIMVYNGEPILAVFHSAAPGQTRRAGDVWSTEVPYLQSVSSPEDGGSIPDYYSCVEVMQQTFCEVFKQAHPEADFTGRPEGWITGVTTAGGCVNMVVVGGVAVRGVELRQLYGLRSAAFEAEARDGKIIFYVTGYGHGVGMSQYGANEMAKKGADWQTILLHYYTGISIEMWREPLGEAV